MAKELKDRTANLKEKVKSIFIDDKVVLCVIILNTISMYFYGCLPQYKWIEFIDIAFTLFFIVEAVFKISTHGWTSYWKDGWNKFDFIIVILALPSLVDPFINGGTFGNTLFAFRALRVFKSFQLFHFIPNITQIMQGIKLAIKASLLVCIAFIVFLIVFSLLSYSIFGKYAPQFFSNPVLSLFSVFRLFTIEGWYEMPEAIENGGGEIMGIFARIYFAILLFAGGIIGMSLINSIFVDAMVSDNNNEVLDKLEHIENEIIKLNQKQDGFQRPN